MTFEQTLIISILSAVVAGALTEKEYNELTTRVE